VQVRTLDVGSGANAKNTFTVVAEWPAHGVIVRESGVILAESAHRAELAAKLHLPTLYQTTDAVKAGGLMS
jgi:hypothetical protein